MSKKNELIADLDRLGFQLSGAHLTRDARAVTLKTFIDTMEEEDSLATLRRPQL
jgi:hypothetical protein